MGLVAFTLVSLVVGVVGFGASNAVRFSADCDRLTGATFFLQAGLFIGAAVAWAAYEAYKDGPDRGMRFVAPVVVFILTVFDTLGAGMYSNQLFDTAPSTTYPALAVADTFESHATDGVGSYYVEMTAPPEDKCSSTWHAEIPRELYQGIVAGHTKLRVDVKPGAFGFPWVKKVSIVK